MKLEYLPEEGDKEWKVFAFYDKNKNRVHWTAATHDDLISEYCEYVVFRRGKVVIVESCGWTFHFRLEVEETPDHAVILADATVDLLETARE